MSSSLKNQIQADIKAAMLAKDKAKVAALRLVTAAIKQKEVDNRIELNDAQITALLEGMIKQRKESLEQYQQAGRMDLVEQEQFELDLITGYMPEPLSEQELETLIQTTITELGASGMQDMGKVMAALKETVQGRADMGKLSQTVKALLQS